MMTRSPLVSVGFIESPSTPIILAKNVKSTTIMVDERQIIGKAYWRLLPVEHFGGL